MDETKNLNKNSNVVGSHVKLAPSSSVLSTFVKLGLVELSAQ
jgi:hypothetical protein